MGTGNLTELTDADTIGVTAVLLGIASELHIRHVLVVQVSPHTRRTVEEHDLARRIMYASRADHDLPKDYASGLLALHANTTVTTDRVVSRLWGEDPPATARPAVHRAISGLRIE